MDFFFNSFMVVMGIGLALITLQLLPTLIGTSIRLVTTKKWQIAKYKSLRARGLHDAAEWGKRIGFAYED